MRERRKYVRSHDLVLIDYKGEHIEGKSSVFDIGGGGIRLIADKRLKVDSDVALEIYLPGDSQPIRVSGKIVWVQVCKERPKGEDKPQKEYFYTGIKFTSLDEHNRRRIANFISRKFF
jgi:Tfp pilus assembly protein PilZ